VIYHFKINEQNHYTFHDSEVSAVCISKQGLVASGERGRKPNIHLWHIKELKPRMILKGYHRSDISLMSFINNDKYLVTCGKRLDTSVIIYEVDTQTPILSAHVDQFVRCIITINNLIGEFKQVDPQIKNIEQNFILLSAEKIYIFQANDFNTYDIKHQKVADSKSDVGIITAGSSFMINYSNPELKAYASIFRSW
jgi:WD40 repeat protein